MPSLHVAVEGLDGSGKTTLISNLAILLGDDFDVQSFRLPDQTAMAGADLSAIVTKRVPSSTPEVLALAFAANRADAYHRSVAPFLRGGRARLALWDRYVLSGLAYQSMQGVPLPWLLALNGHVPPPDLTVFIDTDPDECAARICRRGQAPDLFEVRFNEVRDSFLRAINLMSDRGWDVRVVSGGHPMDALAVEVAVMVRSKAVAKV